MKKIYIIIIILLLFPITVLSKTSKEEINNIIQDIENIQVEDNIIIESIDMNQDKIIMNILEDNINKTVELNYIEDDDSISFTSGNISMPIDNNLREQTIINNNNWAFYLYSILENKTDIPYDENNYYNNQLITNKILNISDLEIQDILNNKIKQLTYNDIYNTFGISLDYINNTNNILNFNIIYHCYFNNDHQVNMKVEDINNNIDNNINDNTILTNPNTSNYQFYVTIMLIFVSILALYSFLTPSKEGDKIYEKNK